MQNWGAQIDDLVEAGSYDDALKLLDTVDQVVLEDKVCSVIRIFSTVYGLS